MSFKDRIREEMTVDHADALEKNFDFAKEFISITKKGHVDVQNKDNLKAADQIILYLIGKMYAKEAEVSETESATRKELMKEIGLPDGTVDYTLKKLYDKHVIEKTKESGSTGYAIKANRIEKELKRLGKHE